MSIGVNEKYCFLSHGKECLMVKNSFQLDGFII